MMSRWKRHLSRAMLLRVGLVLLALYLLGIQPAVHFQSPEKIPGRPRITSTACPSPLVEVAGKCRGNGLPPNNGPDIDRVTIVTQEYIPDICIPSYRHIGLYALTPAWRFFDLNFDAGSVSGFATGVRPPEPPASCFVPQPAPPPNRFLGP